MHERGPAQIGSSTAESRVEPVRCERCASIGAAEPTRAVSSDGHKIHRVRVGSRWTVCGRDTFNWNHLHWAD